MHAELYTPASDTWWLGAGWSAAGTVSADVGVFSGPRHCCRDGHVPSSLLTRVQRCTIPSRIAGAAWRDSWTLDSSLDQALHGFGRQGTALGPADGVLEVALFGEANQGGQDTRAWPGRSGRTIRRGFPGRARPRRRPASGPAPGPARRQPRPLARCPGWPARGWRAGWPRTAPAAKMRMAITPRPARRCRSARRSPAPRRRRTRCPELGLIGLK